MDAQECQQLVNLIMGDCPPDGLTRSSRAFVELIPRPRVAPDVELLCQIYNRVKALTGKDMRPGQLLALYYLACGDRDVLFQAATGYGKSIIWQCICEIGKRENRKAVCIMISPLDLITEQQVENLPPGSLGIGITSENSSQENFEAIKDGKYTHVCIGPELVTSNRFAKEVIEQELFRTYSVYLIIDEVHTVESWVTFRKTMAWIWQLRERCPTGTRLLGCSATLDDKTVDVVKKNAGFRDYFMINTTTDRPEIYLDFHSEEVKHPLYLPLRALFPDQQTDDAVQKLPKALVFFDSKQDARLAKQCCHQWLIGSGVSRKVAQETVSVYYSPLRRKTKQQLAADFAPANSKCRIMLATEAMGMGVEMTEIRTVIQYGSKQIFNDDSGIKTLTQRMGRAARGPGEKGIFLWFLEPWCLPPELPHSVGKHGSSGLRETQVIDAATGEVSRQEQSLRTRRAALPTVFRELLEKCPRDIIFEHFVPNDSRITQLPRLENDRCCYRCQPAHRVKSLTQFTTAKFKDIERLAKRAELNKIKLDPKYILLLPSTHPLHGRPKLFGIVTEKLEQWRAIKAEKAQTESGCLIKPQSIMPDTAVQRLADGNVYFARPGVGIELINHLVYMWSRRAVFAKEIHQIIIDACGIDINTITIGKRQFQQEYNNRQAQYYAEITRQRESRQGNRYPHSRNVVSGYQGDKVTIWAADQKKKEHKAANDSQVLVDEEGQQLTIQQDVLDVRQSPHHGSIPGMPSHDLTLRLSPRQETPRNRVLQLEGRNSPLTGQSQGRRKSPRPRSPYQSPSTPEGRGEESIPVTPPPKSRIGRNLTPSQKRRDSEAGER